MLASVFGWRQDPVLLRFKALLEPFGMMRHDTNYWDVYTRHLDLDEHNPGKQNTQKPEPGLHVTLPGRTNHCLAKVRSQGRISVFVPIPRAPSKRAFAR